MANFDSSKWYQISVTGGGLSFVGTNDVITDNKTTVQPYGTVFLRTSNSSDPEQRWQIFPINETAMVLRTRSAGPSNYLGTAVDMGEAGDINGGNTKPIMGNYSLMDNSMVWSIGKWGNGLFWFENAQNGSAWHLNHTGHGYFDMSSNITAPQSPQSFKFKVVDDINDRKFSTIDLPGATATAAPMGTSTAINPSSDSPSSSDGSSGLSTGVKAAIGASIGGAALLALLVIALLCLRRRRKQGTTAKKGDITPPPYAYSPVQETQALPELHGAHVVPAELPVGKTAPMPQKVAPVELDGGVPAELPADSHR